MTEDEFKRLADYQRGKLNALEHLLHLVVAALPESTQANISDIFSNFADDALDVAETNQSDAVRAEGVAAWDTVHALNAAVKKWRQEFRH